MKRLLYILVLFVVVASFVTFGSVNHAAAASCVIAQASNPPSSTIFFNVITGHAYNYVTSAFTSFIGVAPFTGPFSELVPLNDTVSIVDLSADCSTAPLPLPLFTDGRENKDDALQTAAIYCGVPHDGDVRIYALFNNIGTIAFTVTKAELGAGVQKPASPYLIKSALGAQLWRLQDGSLRIRRGTYVFNWPGC